MQNSKAARMHLAQRSGWLISSHVLRLITQLTVLVAYARLLPVKDYGLYQSAWLYTNLLGVILLFGLPSVILTFPTAMLNNWITKHRRLFIFLLVLFHTAGFVWLYGFTDLRGYERPVLFIYIVLTNISVVFETFMVKQGREKRMLIINVLYYVFFLFLHLYILLSDYSFLMLFGSLTLLLLLKNLFMLPEKRSTGAQADEVLVSKQWLYLGLYDVIGVIFRWLDKWIILYYAGLVPFAIYYNGAYEIPVFALMVSAVSSIMITELSLKAHGSSIKQQFHDSSKLLASFVFPAFAMLLFYHEEFFLLLFSEKYVQSIPVFLVCIFVLPVRITGYTAALQVSGRNEIVFRGALYDLALAIILVLVLYPFFGVRGLAAAFVISTWLQAAYYLWHTARIAGIRFSSVIPFGRLAWMMGLSLTVSGLTYWMGNEIEWNLWLGAATAGGLCLIYFWLYRTGRGFR